MDAFPDPNDFYGRFMTMLYRLDVSAGEIAATFAARAGDAPWPSALTERRNG